MIIHQFYNTNMLNYCSLYFGPNESRSFLNDGIGSTHTHIYISSGSGKFTWTSIDNTKEILDSYDVTDGQLIDVRSTIGQLQLVEASDSGLSVMAINPLFYDKDKTKYKVEIVKGPNTKTVVGEDKSRIVVICVDGKITINDKELVSLQHAMIYPGKTADITTEKNSVIAIVSSAILE